MGVESEPVGVGHPSTSLRAGSVGRLWLQPDDVRAMRLQL